MEAYLAALGIRLDEDGWKELEERTREEAGSAEAIVSTSGSRTTASSLP